MAEAKGFNTRPTLRVAALPLNSKLHHRLRADLMHQTTDWLAARQLPDKCLEPGAKQLLSLALGHLAVRVEAAMMTAPPGLRAGGNDKKLEDRKRAKRAVLPARPEAQPETQSPSLAASLDGLGLLLALLPPCQCQLQKCSLSGSSRARGPSTGT